MDKRCDNCEYYCFEPIDQGYVCVNDDSDYCTDWVEPDHCCADWVRKDED